MAREAHAAARLGHPALVRVFDFGWTRHSDPYLVMELVQGETLAALVRREARIPAIRAVQTLLPIADGLRLAHDKGIVHRDIKPDNVFLAADALGRKQPKLLDFGIAKVDKQIEGRLTQMGAVLGSPDYMSPEQSLGLDDIDERTDIWSLCVVLYEVVTGKVPFQKTNYNALMHAIINEDPLPTIDCGAGDKQLWQIIQRGLRKQREDRFQTVTELGEALALWLYEHGIKEDLSGNSIRAVWLDTAMASSANPRSAPPAHAETSEARRNTASKLPTLRARSQTSSEGVSTFAPRAARRNHRAFSILLPAVSLLLGAAGAWLAFSTQKSAVLPAPLATQPPAPRPVQPAALQPAAEQPAAAQPPQSEPLGKPIHVEALETVPSAPPTKATSAGSGMAKPRAAVRKKNHDFGF
jgi:serine/threonine-protein kinase